MSIVKKICTALISTVLETPSGAPGGILYSAMLVRFTALTSDDFEKLMVICCSTKLIVKRGDCYFPA